MAKKILIAGASGLIGSRLTELFLQSGYEVSHLSRVPGLSKVASYAWDVETGSIDPAALASVDCIINLAGASVADKRWTRARKKEILESRTKSTALLWKEIQNSNYPLSSFISASAIGYYGSGTGNETVTEDSQAGTDFLARVAMQWEAEVEKIHSPHVRPVSMRIGIVLSEKGGALKSMAVPIRSGFGAVLGTGKQYLSWIHLDDLCGMFIKAVEDTTMRGVYNAVGTQPVTNREMTRAIANLLQKPLWLPAVPSAMLRLMLGEMADMVLFGSKVSSGKIQETGFKFKFTGLESALKDAFKV